jgi:hypothetical protein
VLAPPPPDEYDVHECYEVEAAALAEELSGRLEEESHVDESQSDSEESCDDEGSDDLAGPFPIR